MCVVICTPLLFIESKITKARRKWENKEATLRQARGETNLEA